MPESPDPTAAFDPRAYDQVCFACGDRNPHGLRMRFQLDPDAPPQDATVLCRYHPREADQGFPGVLHGGILVTLMDESMAWAMWAKSEALGVTAKMDVRYRRPAPAGVHLLVRARVLTDRGRRLEVESTVSTEDGSRIAEATALFLRLPEAEEHRIAAELGWDKLRR